MHLLLLTTALLASPQDTGAVVAPTLAPAPVSFAPTMDNLALLRPAEYVVIPVMAITSGAIADSEADTTRRPRAVRYSDMYYTRLKIHQVASYLTVPLFVAQYLAGRELWNNGDHAAGWARDAHGPLAGAIAGLFAVNTVTGVWNLVEGRKDPHGRTRRWIHGLSMIAADAGSWWWAPPRRMMTAAGRAGRRTGTWPSPRWGWRSAATMMLLWKAH